MSTLRTLRPLILLVVCACAGKAKGDVPHPAPPTAGAGPASASAPDDRVAAVDALFAAWDRDDSPGCAVGVIQHGELVLERGYGMANLEHGVPLTTRSAFRIASTSKQFTATSIALLEQQGTLTTQDDVRLHIPELPAHDRPITIDHLLHHTSGLRDYLGLMMLGGHDEDRVSTGEAVAMIARQRGLNFEPGSQFGYSNSNYLLLGEIVRRASGRALRAFAEDHIFAPLGMHDTTFNDDHTMLIPRRADGYGPAPDGRGFRLDETTLDLVGDGGVFTTVTDSLGGTPTSTTTRWAAAIPGSSRRSRPPAPSRTARRTATATGCSSVSATACGW